MKTKIFYAFLVLFMTGLICLLFVLCVNLYIKVSAQKHLTSVEKLSQSGEKYDCILVLGAGLRSDGTPTDILRERLKKASELYKAGASDRILVSGDNGRIGYNEVQSMEDCLVDDYDVNREDIVKDYAGFSTYDSMYRAKEIFCVQKTVIVTQMYHLYRAVFIANRLGLDADGVNSNYYKYAAQPIWTAREVAARTKDFFSTVFKPEPKFLGQKIPLQ